MVAAGPGNAKGRFPGLCRRLERLVSPNLAALKAPYVLFMGRVDNAYPYASHDIFRQVAKMFAQYNCRRATRVAAAVTAAVLAVAPVSAGSISSNSGPSSSLTGEAPGPCAQAAAGADYVAGVDATGNAVTPADLPGSSAPLPAGKEVLVHPNGSRRVGADVEVPIDLASVAPPSCDARTTPRR